MNATKKQLIDFICLTFADESGIHPEPSQLESYKKDELIKLIIDAGAENELESYINSFS